MDEKAIAERVARNIVADDFRTAYEAHRALVDSGWKEKRGSSDYVAVKRFGNIWIEAVAFSGSRHLYLKARYPRGLDLKMWDEFREKTSYNFNSVRGIDVSDIERKAKQIAQIAKGLKPKPKRRDYAEFEWRGNWGEDAYKKWVADVIETILEILKNQQDYYDREQKNTWGRRHVDPWLSTGYLMSDVLNNHGMEPRITGGVPIKKRFRAILDALARKRKIEAVKGVEREVVWMLRS